MTTPKQPDAADPKPEIRREPMEEPQPEPKAIPTEPQATPVEPKPTPTEPKPIPVEPKPIPTEPKAPAPESKPRPEDENLFEAVSGAGPAWRAHRRFAVGGGVVEPVAPEGDRVEPATHVDRPDLKRVPRVPFDPAAETRRLRATR